MNLPTTDTFKSMDFSENMTQKISSVELNNDLRNEIP